MGKTHRYDSRETWSKPRFKRTKKSKEKIPFTYEEADVNTDSGYDEDIEEGDNEGIPRRK